MAAPLDADLLAALDAQAQRAAARCQAPAISWGVMVEGRLAHHGALGALDDGREPSAASVFRIASMTKSFTAATVLALRDEGALDIDLPIAELAPELSAVRAPTADSPAITVRHLLSMSSGLATDDPWADRHIDLPFDELTTLIAAGATFGATPGDALEYSNLGYGLIGRVVERVTGRRVREHCEERLLGPLELSRTTWVCPDHDDWARPFRVDADRVVAEREPLGDGEIAPMGGIWTTVGDLIRWMSFLADAYPTRDGPDDGPLRRASRREMQSVQQSAPTEHARASGEGLDLVPERVAGGGYGFGLRVLHDTRFGHHVHHAGGFPGYGSNMRWLPGRGLGVVALANVTYAPMRLLTWRMLEMIDDAGVVPAAPVPVVAALDRAAAELTGLVNHWTPEGAEAVLADNVPLDHSSLTLASAADGLISAHGALAVVRVEIETRSAATVHAVAADGTAVKIPFSLSPTVPPKVQEYDLDG